MEFIYCVNGTYIRLLAVANRFLHLYTIIDVLIYSILRSISRTFFHPLAGFVTYTQVRLTVYIKIYIFTFVIFALTAARAHSSRLARLILRSNTHTKKKKS